MADRAADKMVREADKKNGLRTLCIRPGMALVGAKDLFVASYFRSVSLTPSERKLSSFAAEQRIQFGGTI